jgi:hypothetical protein
LNNEQDLALIGGIYGLAAWPTQATLQAYLPYASSAVKKCKTFLEDCRSDARRSRLHWLSAEC